MLRLTELSGELPAKTLDQMNNTKGCSSSAAVLLTHLISCPQRQRHVSHEIGPILAPPSPDTPESL